MSVDRPILRYHGGKWKLAPWVIENMPCHKVYVEPFGGGASILLRKPPVATEVYNDIDEEILSFFSVVRDPIYSGRLAEAIRRTPYSREEYLRAYLPTSDKVERARRTIVKSFMGQSSKGIWQKSGFDTRINPDGFISRLNAFCAVPAELQAVCERLQRVVIEARDARDVIGLYDREDALFYLDPPYDPATHATRVYRHRMTQEDHRSLSLTLRDVRGMVMLSGYPSALYDELYGDWQCLERGALADGARERTECLWFNPAAWERRPQAMLVGVGA